MQQGGGAVAGFYHTVDAVEHLLLRVALREVGPTPAAGDAGDAMQAVVHACVLHAKLK